jgi:hypothetical protein
MPLDRNGFRVFAGVRKKTDGDALRSSPRTRSHRRTSTQPTPSIAAMVDEVRAQVGDAGRQFDRIILRAGGLRGF